MTPIELYREEVRDAIFRRDGRPLLNGSTEHAAIVIQEALTQAERRVRILCYKLDPVCYGLEAVRVAAKWFLAKCNHRLEFLIESSLWDTASEYNWHEHPFISDLKNFLRNSSKDREKAGLYIKFVPPEWAKTYQCNFLLLDDYGYRLEADRERPAAIAAFFDAQALVKSHPLENLEHMFNRLWDVSTPLEAAELDG